MILRFKMTAAFPTVLIESDWNLNDFILELELELAGSINRIRLEFK